MPDRNRRQAHAAHGMPHSPRASFWAAGLAKIVTRPLDERDHACGNEVIAYPPLSKGVSAQPAYTLGHTFKGAGSPGQLGRPELPEQLRRSLSPFDRRLLTARLIVPSLPRLLERDYAGQVRARPATEAVRPRRSRKTSATTRSKTRLAYLQRRCQAPQPDLRNKAQIDAQDPFQLVFLHAGRLGAGAGFVQSLGSQSRRRRKRRPPAFADC